MVVALSVEEEAGLRGAEDEVNRVDHSLFGRIWSWRRWLVMRGQQPRREEDEVIKGMHIGPHPPIGQIYWCGGGGAPRGEAGIDGEEKVRYKFLDP